MGGRIDMANGSLGDKIIKYTIPLAATGILQQLFIPAACAVIGICGVRLTWIFTVFQRAPSFATIMQVYPLSLGITAAVILAVTLLVKPSRRYVLQPGVQAEHS